MCWPVGATCTVCWEREKSLGWRLIFMQFAQALPIATLGGSENITPLVLQIWNSTECCVYLGKKLSSTIKNQENVLWSLCLAVWRLEYDWAVCQCAYAAEIFCRKYLYFYLENDLMNIKLWRNTQERTKWSVHTSKTLPYPVECVKFPPLYIRLYTV